MKYKTRGNVSPQGKPHVYFTGHPADVEQHFESIANTILNLRKAKAIWNRLIAQYPDMFAYKEHLADIRKDIR